jgi:hypothetical protein
MSKRLLDITLCFSSNRTDPDCKLSSSTLCHEHALARLLQSLFGYDAYHAGLVMSPAGIFSIMAIVGGGALIGL